MIRYLIVLTATLLVSSGACASNDPVRANPNTGANFNRYAYAANNPYKFVDPDGRDVVFSVDPNAAGGNGHTTLYYQDGKGQWRAFNQGATGNGGSGGNFTFLSGSNQPGGVSIVKVDAKDVPTNGLRIETTSQQDSKIADSAAKVWDAHETGQSSYNLYSNNCTDAAVDVVNNSGAGITVSNPATTVRPNSWISEVKNDPDAVKQKDPPKPEEQTQ